jgi:hypothetical protein
MENNIEPARPEQAHTITSEQDEVSKNQQRKIMIISLVAVIVILAILTASVWYLTRPSTDTARIRDIFIIFMALASLLLSVAMIILMIQLAILTNLLQNEIKPILLSTNETVNTLRGTTEFLSGNLVEPVMKLNEYTAALQQFFGILNLGRKRNKTSQK